jgi:hypothetical protein
MPTPGAWHTINDEPPEAQLLAQAIIWQVRDSAAPLDGYVTLVQVTSVINPTS